MKNPLLDAPAISQLQQTLDYTTTGRRAAPITVRFMRGKQSLTAYYDGDLAMTGEFGPVQVKRRPLNQVYVQLLKAYLGEADAALRLEEREALCHQLHELFGIYCRHGRGVHRAAAATVCSDGSRLTTAVTLANNYFFTLIYLTRRLLGDNSDAKAAGPIVIDTHYAGLRAWDGLGMPWGYEVAPLITKVPRADLSRNVDTSMVGLNPRTGDSRIRVLVELCFSGSAPDRKLSKSAEVCRYYPLADAFRATPESIKRVLAGAAAALRASALEGAEPDAEPA